MSSSSEPQIILASTSLPRRQLLESAGLIFVVETSDYEELMDPSLSPHELAKKLALGKAQAVAQNHLGEKVIVIAADTFVVCQGEYLGKPSTPRKAQAVLRKLQASQHEIITGYAVIDVSSGQTFPGYDLAKITLAPMSEAEIVRYVATGEPLTKAGGYAVQGIGQWFVEKIDGNLSTVIGLPTRQIYQILQDLGMQIPRP